jgi:hypothetical protein
MKRKRILIVGTGQLGSRYLQGLGRYNQPLDIWINDPSPTAIRVALERWSEVFEGASNHRVEVMTGEKHTPLEFDIVIISTNADIRPKVVRDINKTFRVQNWILEKVLAQSVNDVDAIVETIGECPAWVNTPMHLWSLYSNLRLALTPGKPIHAVIENFEGLACNSIHFIDYIARTVGSKVSKIESSWPDCTWVEAKRRGYMELNGRIDVNFSDGSSLVLIGNRDAPYHYITRISCGDETWEVNGEKEVALSNTARRISGRLEFQSQITAGIVESIFKTGTCKLPTLEESASQHRPLLAELKKNYEAWIKGPIQTVPIT